MSLEPSRTHHSRLLCALSTTVQRLFFWAAIVLPFVVIAVLVDGLDTPDETVGFVILVVLNAIAIVGGRSHHRH